MMGMQSSILQNYRAQHPNGPPNLGPGFEETSLVYQLFGGTPTTPPPPRSFFPVRLRSSFTPRFVFFSQRPFPQQVRAHRTRPPHTHTFAHTTHRTHAIS